MSKRPLEQLREDPEEREITMSDLAPEATSCKHLGDCCFYFGADVYPASSLFEGFPSFHRDESSRDEVNDYDWDHLQYDYPGSVSVPKRRRADRATPSMISTKIAQRFPSISRRFRSISEKRTPSMADSIPDSRSRSRASSMRSVMTKESLDNGELRDVSHLATPAPSFIEEEPEAGAFAEFSEDLPEEPLGLAEPEAPQSLARTPLLPPVQSMRSDPEPVQSPLHSPKVVATPTSPQTPTTVHYSGLPSPPLSARPSVASFHHRSIVPSSEIPTMALAEPQDEWAVKLGHANFNIEPEPYLPHEPTVEACRKLKADWEEAEHQFGKHLARTRAVYSSTSKVAQLTEEKWAAINALWKSNHEQVLANIRVVDSIEESNILSRQPSLHEPVPVTKIPSHLVGGKFLAFGDRGIVGPMEVAKPLVQQQRQRDGPSHQRTSSRKRAFWKFIQDLLPGSLVKSAA